MYSDTLDMDFLFDIPVRRPSLLSRKMFDVPVRPMDAKGLSISISQVSSYQRDSSPRCPLNIQPVVVVRGLKRQQVAALTNFVGCFFLALSYFFFSFGAE